MVLCNRRPQCGDHITHTMLSRRYNIHITLDNDQLFFVAQSIGFIYLVFAVDDTRLLVEHCFGRVNIFCFGIGSHRPPAESDHRAFAVAYREHNAVAEKWIGFIFVVHACQPRRLKCFGVGFYIGQVIAFWRITQLKFFNNLSRQTALF